MLKYKADWWSVAVITAVTSLAVGQWIFGVRWWAVALAIALALPVAVLAHNHHHAPMWRERPLNIATGYWLTLFYGGPGIAWIAIHNRSHHAHQNRAGKDVTSTFNVGDRNDFVGALLYVPRCLKGMSLQARDSLKTLYKRNPRTFWFHMSHIALLYGTIAILLLVDWRRAVWVLIVPQQVAINAIA